MDDLEDDYKIEKIKKQIVDIIIIITIYNSFNYFDFLKWNFLIQYKCETLSSYVCFNIY